MPILSKKPLYRFLEILPGAFVWLTLLAVTLLSWLRPIWAIYFIILFDLYWLLRVVYFIIYVLISWRQFTYDRVRQWLYLLQREYPHEIKQILHIVFLPTYGEAQHIIDATFDSLLRSHYPKDRIWVVLAGEQRDHEQFQIIARACEQQYASAFGRLIVTEHPNDLPNEIPGKGSNLNYAGYKVKEIIDAEHIPYEHIIVSSFDIDTQPHSEYFAALTYQFLKHPNRLHASYQPVALYNNNIWDADPILRVAAFGTTFWLMTDLARPDRLFTFSSHSMPWQMLVDVGFWQKDIVTEDSRIFLQGFLRYDGDYEVVPIYVPVSMDTVGGTTWWDALVNLYKQQRRWAWGVEHFPYMLWHFREKQLIPLRKKIKYFFTLGEGMYSWATAPIIIFIAGHLPLYFVSDIQKTSALVQQAPFILQWLLSAAMGGIFLSAIVSVLLLPHRPEHKHRINTLLMFIQWILLPITLVIFGAIPAIESQTRLMLGKYLEFNVTQKRKEG